jgi:hypothetical protein
MISIVLQNYPNLSINLRVPLPLFLRYNFEKKFFLFLCFMKRLCVGLSFDVWMSGIQSALSLQNVLIWLSDAAQLTTHITVEKRSWHFSNLFSIFLKNQFFAQILPLCHGQLPSNFIRSSWNFYHKYFEVFSKGSFGRFQFPPFVPNLYDFETQKTGFCENLLVFF